MASSDRKHMLYKLVFFLKFSSGFEKKHLEMNKGKQCLMKEPRLCTARTMYMYIKLAVNKTLPVSVVQTSNYQFLSLENTFQKCVANF